MDVKAQINNNSAIDDNDLIDDSLLAEFEISAFKESSTPKRKKSNLNKCNDIDTSALNVSALCCDEEFSGYDKLAGQKWIYPINYPVRDYQFNIIKAALLKNTLVSLPTGLGKTFIAAVLMYNFYRWYPLGKIVFTAPTRPLIAQQIEACYNIIAMPPEDTIEMTGTMNVTMRKEKWQTKRVFFATPQVVHNDIKSGICPGNKIRCLVIDEAHKAKSNYAYCHIVSTLTDMGHRTYRILALSATPGSRINDVVQVVKNLQIAHLELRNENCLDVAPYCHSRKINTIVVPLDAELSKLRQAYIEILDFYARRLIQMNILKPNLGNLSRGRILMIYKEYQANRHSHPQRSFVMKDLSQLVSLYHGLELLVKHGSRTFLNFFDEHPEKMWIQSDDRLTVMLERLRDDLGVNPLTLNTSVQPDGTIPEIPNNLNFGHPKFVKVKEIMEDHFKKAKENNEDTRAIVFCEYHETVKLVHCLLLQCRPLIKARVFVGQGNAGKEGRRAMPQREQLTVMRQFREGACNALVATCVAEEGLDVGSVDLILCFDVATRSPVRLVQRCGRTGRERSGHVYFLVTEGQEHQTLQDGMRQRDSLKTKILQSREVQENLYKLNPRLVPYDCSPKCEKIHITVRKQEAKGRKKSIGQKQEANREKKNKKDKSLQNPGSFDNCNSNFDFITNIDDNANASQFPNIAVIPSPNKNDNKPITLNFLSPRKDDVKSSVTPSPQSTNKKTSPLKVAHKKKPKQPPGKSGKKNADIRALFLTAKRSNQSRAVILKELQQQNTDIPTHMLDLLINLKMENETSRVCYICQNVCDCQLIQKLKKKPRDISGAILKLDGEPTLPDLDLIKNFDPSQLLYKEPRIIVDEEISLVDNEINDTQNDNNFTEQSCEVFADRQDSHEKDKHQISLLNSHNFEIGDPEDIFADESHEDDTNTNLKKHDIPLPQSSNFDLGSVDDILEDTIINEQLFDDNENLEQNNNSSRSKDVTANRTNCILSKEAAPLDGLFKESVTSVKLLDDHQIIKKSDEMFCGNDFLVDLTLSPEYKDILDENLMESNKLLGSEVSVEKQKNLCDNDTTIGLTESPESKKENKPLKLRSPSILSRTLKTSPMSPILNTYSKKSSKSKLKLNRKPRDNITPEKTARKMLNMESNNLSHSMLSITQTIELINSCEDNSKSYAKEKRSLSPILSTPLNKRRKIERKSGLMSHVTLNRDDHQIPSTSITNKRKFEDDIIASPYFNKKQKLDVLSVPYTEDITDALFNSENNLTNNTQLLQNDTIKANGFKPTSLFSAEYNKTLKQPHDKRESILNLSSKYSYTRKNSHEVNNKDESEPKLNLSLIKLKREKKVKNDFIDLEAEVSGDDCSGSTIELSDDSAGSIVDFVNDRDITHTDVDIQALYLKTTKSPLKVGAFKIPQLPKKLKSNILSQYVEPDSYEMDSFCVDSHIGLTQRNDLSELEIAELILEDERRRKKESKMKAASKLDLQDFCTTQENGDSPIIKRKNHNRKKYYVISDSDDSS